MLIADLVTVVHSRNDLPEEVPGLPFRDVSLVADVVVQVPSAGVFHHNYDLVLIFKDWKRKRNDRRHHSAAQICFSPSIPWMTATHGAPGWMSVQKHALRWILIDGQLIRPEGRWKTQGSAHEPGDGARRPRGSALM